MATRQAEDSAGFTGTALTVVDANRLASLEIRVERALDAWVDAGQALREIRDKRLYRASHPNFETYMQDRWGFSRQRAYQLIEAADTAETLLAAGETPPVSERSARGLHALPKEQQPEAWADAKANAQAAGRSSPSTHDVEQAVKARLVPAKPEPEPPEEPEEPEPENSEPDLAKELEAADAEIRALQARVDLLVQEDQGKALVDLQTRYEQLEGRLMQAVEQKNQAEKQAKWAMEIVRKCMKIVGAGKPNELVAKVTALIG